MVLPLLMLALLMAPRVVAGLRGQRPAQLEHAGRAGILTLFVFTGASHFTSTETMLALVPPTVPWPLAVVYATGVLEIVCGLAVLVPERQVLAGRILVSLLLAFLPANIYGAIYHVPAGGHAWGPVYLLIRIPLQLIIVAWIYRFALRDPWQQE